MRRRIQLGRDGGSWCKSRANTIEKHRQYHDFSTSIYSKGTRRHESSSYLYKPTGTSSSLAASPSPTYIIPSGWIQPNSRHSSPTNPTPTHITQRPHLLQDPIMMQIASFLFSGRPPPLLSLLSHQPSRSSRPLPKRQFVLCRRLPNLAPLVPCFHPWMSK
jgi:hypothetical protein